MPPAPAVADDRWRQVHLGRLMGHALRRFDARVLELMTHSAEAPLALSHLAARGQVGAAIVHITRHLALRGSRLTQLADSAGMSKQAMGDLVDQCEAWGLVRRVPDPLDARAKQVQFTHTGLAWLEAFRLAVQQTEREFRDQVGADVATVVAALPPQVAEATERVEASTIDHIVVLLVDGRSIVWGNADNSAEKTAVLPALLAMSGTVLDVSVPSHPAIR